jgi:hypothetical protein
MHGKLLCMASMLPTPNSCCECGSPLNVTSLEAYLQSLGNTLESLGLIYVANLTELRGWSTSDGNRLAIVEGQTTEDDGLFAVYDWKDSNTDADDGGTTIRPDDYDGSRGGTWKRRL